MPNKCPSMGHQEDLHGHRFTQKVVRKLEHPKQTSDLQHCAVERALNSRCETTCPICLKNLSPQSLHDVTEQEPELGENRVLRNKAGDNKCLGMESCNLKELGLVKKKLWAFWVPQKEPS